MFNAHQFTPPPTSSFNYLNLQNQQQLHQQISQSNHLSYTTIAMNFCNFYYTNYDNNFASLTALFSDNAHITFQGEEFLGFNNYITKLKQFSIVRFKHDTVNCVVQPITPDKIMISSHGYIHINNATNKHVYIETLVLQKDIFNNFSIVNNIVKILN